MGGGFPMSCASIKFFCTTRPLRNERRPATRLHAMCRPARRVCFPRLVRLDLNKNIRMAGRHKVHVAARRKKMIHVVLGSIPRKGCGILVGCFRGPGNTSFRI